MQTLAPPARLTSAEAMQLHGKAASAGLWPMWFIATDEPAFPGCHVARAHTMDRHGGVWLPGALVADTLAGVAAMLPPGLVQEDRTPLDPWEVVEVWS